LPGNKKSFNQLALAAYNHFRESLEPFSLRHLRVGIHLPHHQSELLSRNLSLLNSLQQVSVQNSGQIVTANLRHDSLAIESARYRGLQTNDFSGIFCVGQPIRQLSQFIRAQLTFAGQLQRVLNYLCLFLRWQLVNLFNHFRRGHQLKITRVAP
jgi:hypothetical protein